jgi:hypothetical protein
MSSTVSRAFEQELSKGQQTPVKNTSVAWARMFTDDDDNASSYRAFSSIYPPTPGSIDSNNDDHHGRKSSFPGGNGYVWVTNDYGLQMGEEKSVRFLDSPVTMSSSSVASLPMSVDSDNTPNADESGQYEHNNLLTSGDNTGQYRTEDDAAKAEVVRSSRPKRAVPKRKHFFGNFPEFTRMNTVPHFRRNDVGAFGSPPDLEERKNPKPLEFAWAYGTNMYMSEGYQIQAIKYS